MNLYKLQNGDVFSISVDLSKTIDESVRQYCKILGYGDVYNYPKYKQLFDVNLNQGFSKSELLLYKINKFVISIKQWWCRRFNKPMKVVKMLWVS